MHVFIGLVVVAVLMAGFVLGSRLQREATHPPVPPERPCRPPTDRLPGETSEFRRAVAVPRRDRKQRLRPYQLRGRTERVAASEN
ncbi:DUF6479 family protein [Streptomyces omiyaensis]|uniref:DUF6479 family protein n=1 Tax=Streptomyces omiyaensis TaxID=68247 RepID=A0ABW7C597_9ACTN|nr:DUF6479 family protein [Streptomyces omiyaensis]GGY81028.1 hypothetical protein GCM10010363_72300 [Streptomyces omiyaensis]